jgi:hypothetical protein
MKLIKDFSIYETPDKDTFLLYNKTNGKNIEIGQNEKDWIKKLEAKNIFSMSDLYEIVGNKYYILFYKGLEDYGFISGCKTPKLKKNIFKLKMPIGVSLTNKISIENSKLIIFFLNSFIMLLLSGVIFNIYQKNNTIMNFSFLNSFDLKTILFWLISVFVSGSIHEIMHGVAAKKNKIESPNSGFLLLVFNPSLYIDLSSIKFIKDFNNFLEVMLAGIKANLMLFLLGVLLIANLGQNDFLNIFIFTNLILIFINLIPFFHLDGGIVLSRVIEMKEKEKSARIFKYIQVVFVYATISTILNNIFIFIVNGNKFLLELTIPISFFISYIYMRKGK